MDFFKIVYDLEFVIQLIIVCTSFLIVFYPLKRNWKSVLFLMLNFVLLFGFGTILNWGLFELALIAPIFKGINFPISWILLIFVYLIFVKIPIINRVIIGGTLFISVYSMINLCRQLMLCIGYDSSRKYYFLLFYSFIIIYSVILRKLSLKEYTDLPMVSAIMMLVITASVSFILIGKEEYDVLNDGFHFDMFYVITLISFYFISVSSYLMLYFYAKARKRMLELQVENKLLEADKERVKSAESAIEEYHLIRHDINNQMNVLEVLLDKKDYDSLHKYFESMHSNFVRSSKYDFIDCGNPLINSVINMEILKGKRDNVDIRTNINVPEKLPFEASDICRILVNLIDNSIEALLRTDETLKFVDISILKHGEYLYIGVQNKISVNTNPEKLLKMNTEKDDQANHGFGHRIVKRIANKYNGHANYSVEDGVFFAEVMLDMNFVVKED